MGGICLTKQCNTYNTIFIMNKNERKIATISFNSNEWEAVKDAIPSSVAFSRLMKQLLFEYINKNKENKKEER